MTSQQLYQLSKKYVEIAHVFRDVGKKLFDYNVLRYSFFVDGSSAGTKCTFAQATEELVYRDNELVLIKQYLQEVLLEIDEMIKGTGNGK